MTYPDSLYSLNLERHILGGLFNNPECIFEIENIFSEKEFVNRVHQVIFVILKEQIISNKKIDKILIAQKISDLGIRFQEDINIFDYIDNLTYIKINKEGLLETSKELIKLKIRRQIYDSTEEVKSYIIESNNKSIEEIIGNVDRINHEVLKYSNENDPVDIYNGVEEFLKKIAKNPVEEVGLRTPFEQFNKMFGGIRWGNGCYNIISRSGEGKSAFLFNIAKGVSKLNKCPVLILDTEMDLNLNMLRAASAESQVNLWHLETGLWSRNEELAKKVLKSFEQFNIYKGNVFHKSIPNKDISEVLSIIRKWYYKHVGRGNKALIIYDYLKITSDIDKSRAEYQQMGDKLSYLNEIGQELEIPIFTATQQNRSAEQMGKRLDDSTTVSMSDRINWYVAFNAVFRRKSLDEINEQGKDYGTHILKPIKTSRTQGKEDYNKNSLVRVVRNDGKIVYEPNFINYEMSEFELIERETFKDAVNKRNLQIALQGAPHH